MAAPRAGSKLKWEVVGTLGVLVVIFIFLYFRVEAIHSRHVERHSIDHGGHTNHQGHEATSTDSSLSLTLWSSDFHISPIADIKQIVNKWGVKVIDKSLSGHCHLTSTCAYDLKVINRQNGISLPCSNALRRDFYDAYRNDETLRSVDAFICTHADSMCELFMPFGRPLIIVASTRYEIGRLEAPRWQRWNDNLQRISLKPVNTIATNNQYDRQYMQYFTNLTDAHIHVLPNLCQYVTASYQLPSRQSTVLLAPYRGIDTTLRLELAQALQTFVQSRTPSKNMTHIPSGSGEIVLRDLLLKRKAQLEIKTIAELYPKRYEYYQLASHPAIVLLPYQVSIMSFFEFYHMNIPLFVPSIPLLVQWHRRFNLLKERTWMGVYDMPQRASNIPRHPQSHCTLRSDPNDDLSDQALTEWLSLSDFYTWPHVTVFHSFDDLFQQLLSKNLQEISEHMRAHNALIQRRVQTQWAEILHKIAQQKEQRIQSGDYYAPLPEDINDALARDYGIKLVDHDCEQQIEAHGSVV